MPIDKALAQFCEYSQFIKGYSKATIKRYKYVINLYKKYTGVSDTEHITIHNIKSLFLHGRTERNWQTSTYLVFYKSLKVFCKWCITEKLLTHNPVDEIEKPRLERKLPPKLNKNQALLLLEIVDNLPYKSKFLRYRNYAMFCMFIFAGLRLNELLTLRYSDVDLENSTIFIHQGKGNKDRIIPISGTLLKSLERYVVEREKINKTCIHFFTSYTRNAGFSDSGMKRLVLTLREASGMKFSIHKLRHTFATLMLEGGCDIYSLSKMMGHSDIKTTTIYLAASTEHLKVQIIKHPLNTIHL